MPYQEPVVRLTEIYAVGAVLHITLDLRPLPAEPLAPASLHAPETPADVAAELRRVVARTEQQITFEASAALQHVLIVGGRYVFRAWWTPAQFAAVTDTGRIWVRETYPSNSDHDHCVLTWTTIAANAEQREAYRSGRDWITIEAYNRYIRDDFLGVRKP